MSTHDRIVTRVYIDGRLALVQTVIGQVGRLSSVTANREKNTVLELPRDVLLADTFTIREPDRRTWYGRKVPGLVHQIRIDRSYETLELGRRSGPSSTAEILSALIDGGG